MTDSLKQTFSDLETNSSHPLPDYLGHRKRMYKKLLEKGAYSLTEAEIMELILMKAIPRKDVKPLAKQLLRQFISLRGVLTADVRQLQQIKGVKESTITLIKLIESACMQMVTPNMHKGTILSEWAQILDFCRLNLSHIPEEHLFVIYLDDKRKIIICDDFQRGTKNKVQIFPIDIMKRALNLSASALILVHNHPSGKAYPSKEDLYQTLKLEELLESVGICIFDHLIIGNNQIYSINSKGIIDEKRSESFISPLPIS